MFRNPKLNTFLFIGLCFCLCLLQGQCQVFIRYDQLYESTELVKFFYDFKDGYFVDIGGFDPLTYSNTLFLYSMGWTGVNVQAHPKRFSQFFYSRKQDLNLNIAISQNLSYVTLYNNVNAEGTSTINPEVKKTLEQSSKNKLVEIEVPAMTMKQICHRYYQKQPNYMNLEIEGFSSFALLGNDWTDMKCKPEIITVQVNHSFDDSKIKSPQQILKENGYKYHSKVQLSEFWIEGSSADKYFKKYEDGKKLRQKIPVIFSNWILNGLYKKVQNRTRQLEQQLDLINDPFFYYFPKENTQISLDNANRESNLYSPKKNRPILILNYNPQNTAFVVNGSELTVEKFSADGFIFANLTIKKQKYSYSAYVYGEPKLLYIHAAPPTKDDTHSASTHIPLPDSSVTETIPSPETNTDQTSTAPVSPTSQTPNTNPNLNSNIETKPNPQLNPSASPAPVVSNPTKMFIQDNQVVLYMVGSSLCSFGVSFIIFAIYLNHKSSKQIRKGRRVEQDEARSAQI